MSSRAPRQHRFGQCRGQMAAPSSRRVPAPLHFTRAGGVSVGPLLWYYRSARLSVGDWRQLGSAMPVPAHETPDLGGAVC
jgi:hypothetical protein